MSDTSPSPKIDKRLFNCCADCTEPEDWSVFNWLEIHPVIEDPESGWCEVCQPNEASFWSVYAHLKDGGCECLTDVPTKGEALSAMADIQRLSGLPIHDDY